MNVIVVILDSLRRDHVGLFFTFLLPLAVVGVLVTIRNEPVKRYATVIGGAGLFSLFYIFSVCGPGLTVHRFYVPVVPLFAFLFGITFVGSRNQLRRSPEWLRAACLTAAVVAAIFCSASCTLFSPTSVIPAAIIALIFAGILGLVNGV